MVDNDDYMVAKTYGDDISETMWDRLQEGVNANRRFRVKGIAGGNNMRYDTTKVVWDTDIYIYFTRESDGAWVYNKINANPTTGITCGDDDLLYVTLNDTTATVLTVTALDYLSMLTDDTGRILILGAVRSSRWYGISSTDLDHDNLVNTHNLTTDVDHTTIQNIGSNAHTVIDTHLGAANPHSGSGDMNDLIDDTTPQLGGDLDLNQKQISLNATALADHAATGIIITLTAASSGVTLGNAVYINASGQVARADADTTTTMPAIGLALETKTSAACQVLIWGHMRDNSWAWVDGGVNGLIYISTTAGAMTQTPPSGLGDQVQVIGHAITPDYILVMPSPVIVEVS